MHAHEQSATTEEQRAANVKYTLDVHKRAHSGRWPTWIAIDMRRVGDLIYEVARSTRDDGYYVVTWDLVRIGVSMKRCASLRLAQNRLRALAGGKYVRPST